jgi:hypothetical protein
VPAGDRHSDGIPVVSRRPTPAQDPTNSEPTQQPAAIAGLSGDVPSTAKRNQ